jgi:hypothetical protein
MQRLYDKDASFSTTKEKREAKGMWGIRKGLPKKKQQKKHSTLVHDSL